MRLSARFIPRLGGFLVFPFLLAAGPALAASEAKNCPAEPTQDVPIVSGNVYAGTNCIIAPATDLDSFEFSGNKNDIYRIALALNGEPYPKNICLDLYDPNGVKVVTACSSTGYGAYAVATDQTLAASGLYRILVSEAGNDATANYALSLERLYPTAPDARSITLAQAVTDSIDPLTDSDAFKFYATPQGKYRLTALIASGGYPQNVCVEVIGPTGVHLGTAQCTSTGYGATSVSFDVTPTVSGTHEVLIYEAGYDAVVGYTLNIQCVTGCQPPPAPYCTLKDLVSYNSGTITMKFTLGNQEQVSWRGWLNDRASTTLLWQALRPVTYPNTVSITKTAAVASGRGTVGILSTMTTPTKGIVCSSWVYVNTGPPPGGSTAGLDEQTESEADDDSGPTQIR